MQGPRRFSVEWMLKAPEAQQPLRPSSRTDWPGGRGGPLRGHSAPSAAPPGLCRASRPPGVTTRCSSGGTPRGRPPARPAPRCCSRGTPRSPPCITSRATWRAPGQTSRACSTLRRPCCGWLRPSPRAGRRVPAHRRHGRGGQYHGGDQVGCQEGRRGRRGGGEGRGGGPCQTGLA